MGSIKLKSVLNDSVTVISNNFIDNYMPRANPTFSLIYIYLFRHIKSQSDDLELSIIADNFNILESDVVRAIEYWESERLLKINKSNDEMEIEFYFEETKNVEKEKIDENPAPAFSYISKPTYTPKEIEVYMEQVKEVSDLFQVAGKYLGRFLTPTDLSTIFSFYDWLNLPIEVIEKLISYCVGNGHRTMNYIEAVAIDWSREEINTVEEAEKYIHKYNYVYRRILKFLGVTNRDPQEWETEIMDKWLGELEMSIELIEEACKRTLKGSGEARMKYVNTILESWHKKGIKTIEQAKKDSEDFNKSKEQVKTKVSKKPNKTQNYKSRTWDYKKLEELERERFLSEDLGS